MKYEPKTAIEMLLDAWKDGHEQKMKDCLRERTRGDLIDSIYFKGDFSGEHRVTVYPANRDDYYVELPIYGDLSWEELVDAIEEAWYSDPEDIVAGKYKFKKV